MKPEIVVSGIIDKDGAVRLTCRRAGVDTFPFANLVTRTGENSALVVTYGFDLTQDILHGDLETLVRNLEDLL